MLQIGCDLASAGKPWDCHKKVVNLVTSEFFAQGDRERLELNKEPNVKFQLRKLKISIQFTNVSFFFK
jgi:dual 3',5'-cyclic-AMP and -GMP phosphodiesterase 11